MERFQLSLKTLWGVSLGNEGIGEWMMKLDKDSKVGSCWMCVENYTEFLPLYKLRLEVAERRLDGEAGVERGQGLHGLNGGAGGFEHHSQWWGAPYSNTLKTIT